MYPNKEQREFLDRNFGAARFIWNELVANFNNYGTDSYINWYKNSFKKCVVRVNQKEFAKIAALPDVYIGHEKNTLEGKDSCIVVCPMQDNELPNVLKFAKLWSPKQ